MSGGRLVVLDRSGRDVKRYSLPDGLVTLGSDPACDIRVMLPTVSEHHATVVVRANQTIVRNISDGETLVNGEPVSVAALKHGDTITLGDRSLRWEYDQPSAIRAVNNPPSLLVKDAGKQRGRGRKRVSETAPRKIDPAVHLMLEMNHRASMPGGGKQVAIVQPQRRDALDKDTTPRLLVKPHRPYSQGKRQRASTTPKQIQDLPEKTEDKSKRKSTTPKMTPKTADLSTTKASMWIESRKNSPRNVTPRVEKMVVARRSVASARKVTPLRTVVLRRAITPNVRFVSPRKTPAPKVAKIQAPLEIDHTKQAALMLMTGHTPKSKIFSPKPQSATLVVKKQSPVIKGAKKSPQSAKKSIRSANNTPQSAIKNATKTSLSGRKSGRQSKLSVTANSDDTPKRLSNYTHQTNTTGRSSRRSRNESTMVLEISDNIDARQSRSSRNRSSLLPSPALPSPKKSALKDPSAKKTGRKTDSKIQFDLSNLDNYSHDSTDVMIVSNTTRDRSRRSNASVSDSEMSLHYSDTSQNNSPSPSPRRSINSRSSKILGSVLGTTIEASTHEKSTLTPESPYPRKYLRGSLMVQKVLEIPDKRYSNRTTKSMSNDANRTKTSPRSPRRNGESYSIVDLVSIDSNVSRSSSVYNSVRSSITTFGTPRAGRKTRSTINPTLLGSSTPYIGKPNSSTRSSRASKRKSSPIGDATVSLNPSSSPKRSKSLSTPVQTSANTSRRSASLCTPEDAKRPISVNSTRVSRASRRTLNDTVELLSPASDDTPVTSRRASRLLDRSLSASKSKLSRLSSPKSQDSSPKSQYASLQTSTISSRASTRSPQASPKSPRNSAIYQQVSARSSRASTKSPLVSPKSPRAGTKSPRTSTNSPKVTSPRFNDKSRKDLSLNIHESPERGTITPDNTLSPEEASTPMLSIRSLLESSQTSFASQRSSRHSDFSQVFQKQGKVSANLKRKTIGALNPRSEPRRGRTGIKSKSLNFGVIRKALLRLSKDSSNTSDKTDEEAPRPNNEDTITPKSTVKLIQEAVKEKHSTAKKPQSKRSIIDNLNESDVVKQLFNSPVKRKLSQSMTEFSRKQSLELASAKKRSRNTIALTGRTPDVSFSDHTVALAPEEFVSPLNTPQNSPNVSSVKRLFTRSTPQKVSAEKAPKQPARTRKSVKNDLTNISGVKNVFSRSPRNSLSNIRGVKDIFASPPANDLRRISGVKALFKGKTPKNDLTDVRGVRNLYKANSPKNDLRNVSGVKKTLRGSPRNDLKDVRGVKRLFTREKSKDGLNDFSGIEELFDTSINSDKNSRNVSANDIIFDQLVGKRPIKATYSKTFSAKNIRSAKSLNVSFDLISNNVEDWLEKELQKRISKTDSLINPTAAKGRKSNISAKSKASKSNSTSNVARELQNLVTDTVEGQSSSTRQSRVRTSTTIKSIPDIIPESKSTSKVNTSTKNRANASKAKLPVKKIILPSSTPMKGQTNITADASVLSRVSPIVADKTHALNASRSIKAPLSPKPKPVIGTKRVTKSVVKPASPKSASPKKNVSASNTENSKNLSNRISPVKEVRKTRGRKTAAKTEITNTRKGRASLVITKKQPILSPQPPSPKLTRKGRRNANQEEAKTTKTAAKKVASPKQGPKKVTKKAASPKKLTKKIETPKASPKKAKTTRGKKLEDKPATPKINRTRVNKNSNLVISKPSPQLKPQSKAKNNKTDIVFEEPKNKRGRRLPEKQISEDLAPRRGRVKKIESPPKSVEKPKRGRKATEKPEQTVKASTSLPAKRGRNAKTEDSVQETKTRGRKTQPSAEKPKRGRSTVAKDIDITKPSPAKGRKRKADVEVAEVKSTRQKKSEVKSDDKKGKTAKAQKAAPKPAENAKEIAKKPEQTKPVRGKKAVEEAPKARVTRGRKRKSDPEPANDNKKSPAKRARTTAQTKKPSPVKVKSPVKSVRTRRQKEEPMASTSTGRSRRR